MKKINLFSGVFFENKGSVEFGEPNQTFVSKKTPIKRSTCFQRLQDQKSVLAQHKDPKGYDGRSSFMKVSNRVRSSPIRLG